MKKRKPKKNKPGNKNETEDKMNATTAPEKSINNTDVLAKYDEERVGICFTCINKDSCFNLARAEGRPIWFCENFDDSVKLGETYGKATIYPAYTRLAEAAAKKKTRFKGLCANCENTADCRLSHKMGGVWHCEEYL